MSDDEDYGYFGTLVEQPDEGRLFTHVIGECYGNSLQEHRIYLSML